MAALATPDLQETAIREALSFVPLPEGVKLLRLDFENNSHGDPAVFVVYSMAEIGKSDEDRAKELSALDTATLRPIWKLGLPLFPYTTYVSA